MRTSSFAVAPLFVFASGCMAEHLVPVAWSVPGIEIDVDSEREVLEQSLCADATAHSCRVLSALHATEGGATARAPSLPTLLPRAFVMHETRETIDVAEWLDEQRREVHDILPNLSFSLPADEIPEALDGFTIAAASVRFDDDELDVNLPELDILVDGERIGVVSEHAGGSGTPAVVSLVDGGAAALRRSLSDGGELVLAPIDASALSFLLPAGERLHRPAGTASVGLDLVVEVSTANLVELMN